MALTRTQIEDIVTRYVAGEKVEAIAAAYGICPSYPRRLAKKRGHQSRQRGHKVVSLDIKADMIARYRAGDKLTEIAAALSVSEGWITRVAHKNGCKRRNR